MSINNRVFGIDLGTTYSAIAYVDEHGQPVVIKNTLDDGQATMPSVVLIEESGNVVVGSTAKKDAIASPDRVFEEIKRSMGDPNYLREIDGKEYKPEEVSGMILKKMAQYASNSLGEEVKDVVITVPAYFTDIERQATRSAGEIAGLNVIHIINEPTAAAFDFGMDAKSDKVALVYDLGGGTFDVTIIKVEEDEIKVIVTGGDHDLGGKRWDQAIINYIADEFVNQHGVNPLDDPISTQELVVGCEEAKKALTSRESTKIYSSTQGVRFTCELTRETFDELTAHLLGSSLTLTADLIEKAKEKGVNGFDVILLVGGSTRMPQIAKALKATFNSEPEFHDPDEAVAKGAALMGLKIRVSENTEDALKKAFGSDATTENVSEVDRENAYLQVADSMGLPAHAVRNVAQKRIINVLSQSIGIVVGEDNHVQVMLPLNTPLPASKKDRFGTQVDYQENVLIQVVQGEGRYRDECTLLNNEDNVLDIPPGLLQGSPIDVEFSVDSEGKLKVEAIDLTSGKVIHFEPNRPGVMGGEEVKAASQALDLLSIQ